MADINFWLDLETSGLEIGIDAILEVAWMFTDSEYRMITPLRQRLAHLKPNPRHDRKPRDNRGQTPQMSLFWKNPNNFDTRNPGNPKLVMDMHEESGLMGDHLAADPESVFTDPRDFERAFMDDIVAIGKRMEEPIDRIILSGAGVSHMDNYMLAEFWPKRFPLMPPMNHPMAYWYLDTSIAARMLPSGLLKQGRGWAAEPGSLYSILACEEGTNVVAGPVDFQVPDAVGDISLSRFDLGGVVPHRAADDLVVSLVDARLIRNLREFV